MLYPIYVHAGDENHAHGITFPDFPGCFSAADEWQDIPAMVQEALECHMWSGELPIPTPTPLEILALNPEYEGGVWMLVDIDVSKIDPTPRRINVSLPRHLLSQIDAYAQAHHLTRSGFLAKAAPDAMRDHK